MKFPLFLNVWAALSTSSLSSGQLRSLENTAVKLSSESYPPKSKSRMLCGKKPYWCRWPCIDIWFLPTQANRSMPIALPRLPKFCIFRIPWFWQQCNSQQSQAIYVEYQERLQSQNVSTRSMKTFFSHALKISGGKQVYFPSTKKTFSCMKRVKAPVSFHMTVSRNVPGIHLTHIWKCTSYMFM